MKNRILALLGLLALAGCETTLPPPPPPPPPPPAVARSQIIIQTPYRAEDFAWSTAIGSARIHGTTAPNYSCAGKPIALTPDTPYSRERIRKLYGSVEAAAAPIEVVRARVIANDNPDMRRFLRSTICDQAGNFAFEGLPAGAFFVIGEVSSPNGPEVVMRRVSTAAGRLINLPLTGPVRP